MIVQFGPVKYRNKEAAIAAVAQSGKELEFCSPKLQNHQEVVMVAMKNWAWALMFAFEGLKANKAFVIKALNEGIDPCGVVGPSSKSLKADLEVISLAVDKCYDGWAFTDAEGEVALNKGLAAKALVKFGDYTGGNPLLWQKLNPAMQEFFPRKGWLEKAKAYLRQIEQEKQAELASGGCTSEDAMVW